MFGIGRAGFRRLCNANRLSPTCLLKLFFLAMPTPIPPILSPYLSAASPGSLLLITSVLSAPANWLVVRSISTALHVDQARNARPSENISGARASSGRRVILLSILRPLSLWAETGKKAVCNCVESRRNFRAQQLLTLAAGSRHPEPHCEAKITLHQWT
jgi:hypothetical protein